MSVNPANFPNWQLTDCLVKQNSPENYANSIILVGLSNVVKFEKHTQFLVTQSKIEDKNGNLPLHLIFYRDDSETDCLKNSLIARRLLYANPNGFFKQNNSGLYPVHIACLNGDFTSLQLFLDFCPRSIAFKTDSNITPLHLAVVGGHSDLCRYLALRYPEALFIATSSGFIPEQIAVENKNHKMEKLLCKLRISYVKQTEEAKMNNIDEFSSLTAIDGTPFVGYPEPYSMNRNSVVKVQLKALSETREYNISNLEHKRPSTQPNRKRTFELDEKIMSNAVIPEAPKEVLTQSLALLGLKIAPSEIRPGSSFNQPLTAPPPRFQKDNTHLHRPSTSSPNVGRKPTPLFVNAPDETQQSRDKNPVSSEDINLCKKEVKVGKEGDFDMFLLASSWLKVPNVPHIYGTEQQETPQRPIITQDVSSKRGKKSPPRRVPSESTRGSMTHFIQNTTKGLTEGRPPPNIEKLEELLLSAEKTFNDDIESNSVDALQPIFLPTVGPEKGRDFLVRKRQEPMINMTNSRQKKAIEDGSHFTYSTNHGHRYPPVDPSALMTIGTHSLQKKTLQQVREDATKSNPANLSLENELTITPVSQPPFSPIKPKSERAERSKGVGSGARVLTERRQEEEQNEDLERVYENIVRPITKEKGSSQGNSDQKILQIRKLDSAGLKGSQTSPRSTTRVPPFFSSKQVAMGLPSKGDFHLSSTFPENDSTIEDLSLIEFFPSEGASYSQERQSRTAPGDAVVVEEYKNGYFPLYQRLQTALEEKEKVLNGFTSEYEDIDSVLEGSIQFDVKVDHVKPLSKGVRIVDDKDFLAANEGNGDFNMSSEQVYSYSPWTVRSVLKASPYEEEETQFESGLGGFENRTYMYNNNNNYNYNYNPSNKKKHSWLVPRKSPMAKNFSKGKVGFMSKEEEKRRALAAELSGFLQTGPCVNVKTNSTTPVNNNKTLRFHDQKTPIYSKDRATTTEPSTSRTKEKEKRNIRTAPSRGAHRNAKLNKNRNRISPSPPGDSKKSQFSPRREKDYARFSQTAHVGSGGQWGEHPGGESPVGDFEPLFASAMTLQTQSKKVQK